MEVIKNFFCLIQDLVCKKGWEINVMRKVEKKMKRKMNYNFF